VIDLYVKLRVADYRGENVENIEKTKKEILDGYNKLHDEYVTNGNLPPADSCYYLIRKHYIEHNGVEPPKNISLIIEWDRVILLKALIYIFLLHHFVYYYIYFILNLI
jgi:hypothetical protein